MNAIFDNEQFWQVVGYVLGGGLSLGVVAFVSKYAAKWGKQAAYYARKWEPALVAAVDEASDPFIVQLDKLFPGAGKVAVKVAPAVLRTLADELEKLLAEVAPAPVMPLLPPVEAVK